MPITPDQIDEWRGVSEETATLEFKEAKAQFDGDTLLSYCVAIANEGGGHLVLGVRNKAPREVVGTSAFQNPHKITKHILDTLGFRVHVHEVSHPAGRVVVFEIPSRPIGHPYDLRGTFLMRSGECLVPMTPDQLRKIFYEVSQTGLNNPHATIFPRTIFSTCWM